MGEGKVGGVRVVVVEDDQAIGASVRDYLRGEGHAVSLVADGALGLTTVLEGGWDCVVLDILLPSMNGFRVCSALREAGCQTPVLMLTAKDGEYDIAEALDSGADDYLVKPFSLIVLAARLRALVRRVGGDRRATMTVGPLCLDPSARRCVADGVDVGLTNREYALLDYLARQRGGVVSRAQIIEGVWDPSFDGDPNIVEVYVGHLRRKLDGRGAALLQTVRGAGYRLAENGF